MGTLDLTALREVRLQGTDGAPVRLGSLWEGREAPLVLVWLRHYG